MTLWSFLKNLKPCLSHICYYMEDGQMTNGVGLEEKRIKMICDKCEKVFYVAYGLQFPGKLKQRKINDR